VRWSWSGIDVANRHLGPFAPVAVYQPFELEASLLQHGLASADELTVDCLDINPFIVRHLEGAFSRARAGQGYPLTVFHFLRGPFAFPRYAATWRASSPAFPR
jgi:hypothetical protein